MDLADATWHYGPLAQLEGAAIEVLTPDAVLGAELGGGRVVIWDGDGSAIAVGLAELLAERGTEVVLATTFDRVAPTLDATFDGPPVRRRLRALGVRTLVHLQLVGVDGSTLVFATTPARMSVSTRTRWSSRCNASRAISSTPSCARIRTPRRGRHPRSSIGSATPSLRASLGLSSRTPTVSHARSTPRPPRFRRRRVEDDAEIPAKSVEQPV